MSIGPAPDFLVSKICILAVLAVPAIIAGCAPGMSDRSLGAPERARPQVVESKPPEPEVVVVKPDPEVVVVKPDPEQVRAAEMRSVERETAQLREELEATRSRADAAVARADTAARESQAAIKALQAELAELTARADAKDRGENEAIRALQTELADVTVRTDTAVAQSNKAVEIATEFLTNLVAAREEQKALVERNLRAFDAIDTRLTAIEERAVQTRKQSQADVAAALVASSALDVKLHDADQELAQLREQMIQLNQENEETRAAIDSSPMLRMLQELESTQRDTSLLRGALEEVRREQEAARKRMQNYYLDLDARIQALQAKERAAPKPGANGIQGDDTSVPELLPMPVDQSGSVGTSASDAAETPAPSSGELPKQDIDSGTLPPLQIVPYEGTTESAGATAGPAANQSLQNAPGEVDASLEGAAVSTDAADDMTESPDKPAPQPSPLPDAMDSTFAPGSDGRPEDSIEHERISVPGQEGGDPALTIDGQDAGGNIPEASDWLPARAHGSITTDWEVGKQSPALGGPAN